MKITIINPVECQVSIADKKVLSPCLSYEAEFWRQGKFSKKRKVYRKNLIDKKGCFLFGLLPKVLDYCELKNIDVELVGEIEELTVSDPDLSGVTWREAADWEYQLEMIHKAVAAKRGVVKNATGVGKTMLALGVAASFKDARVLILAHTRTIVTQTRKKVVEVGLDNRVDVDTVQKFYHKDPEEYWDKYDVVIVDECHHVTNPTGMYAKVLRSMAAPVRLGFTATLPPDAGARFNIEGFLGPVIGEITIQTAVEWKILSEPKVEIVRVPLNTRLRGIKKWPAVYDAGIVHSRSRNRLVVKVAKEAIEGGESVLILVIRIDHGQNIVDTAKRLYDLDLVYVQGATGADVREDVRIAMEDKEVKGVVATAVFREGLDIPSLDVVVNAGLMKSELMTLQAIGRGLRRTSEKTRVRIVDFFDPSHHYLVAHFGERLCLFMDNNWL